MKKPLYFLFLLLVLAAPSAIQAQEPSGKGMPDEDYYLMPAFADGYVYIRGQMPAQGKLNICAVDNTLRFIDDNGTELAAANEDGIVKVQIDTVWFLRSREAYYRMFPVTSEVGIALKRDVTVMKDVKEGAYGIKDRTSSIREYTRLYNEAAVQVLNQNRTYPYEVAEKLFLYQGETIYMLTKKNLKKLFPTRKDEIEAYFKSGNSVPDNATAAQALLQSWMQ